MKSKRIKRQSDTFPPTLPILPLEVISEILSWMPVKSLVQCNCVSKSLRSLISEPQFIKTHLSHCHNSLNPIHQMIAISSYGCPVKTYSLASLFHGSCSTNTSAVLMRDSNHPSSSSSLSIHQRVVGSCDGLLCVAINTKYVFVINPSTRVFNRIPDPGIIRTVYEKHFSFGFGKVACATSVEDHYKVVCVYCDALSTDWASEVKVCSLSRADRQHWRSIGEFGDGRFLPYNCPRGGRYVSGRLCWAAWRRCCWLDGRKPPLPSTSWVIVGFDLARECWEEVAKPDYGEDRYFKTLWVLDGCLCVMCMHNVDAAELWVMREYGVGDSWTKLFTIPYFELPGQFHYSPIFVSADGEVLLEFKSKFMIYNLKDGTFKYPVVVDGVDSFDRADLYVGSLVSPLTSNVSMEEPCDSKEL